MNSHSKQNPPMVGSLSAAWLSLRLNLRKLFRHESQALRTHWDDAQIRATVATQAGDVSTLVRDQMQLLSDSRARLRAHWQGSRAIVQALLLEWYSIGREYYRSLLARQ